MGEDSSQHVWKPNMRAEMYPVKHIVWPFLRLGLWLPRREELQG